MKKDKKLLFLKKKKQKDFMNSTEVAGLPESEVFWFFFSKKNRFLPKG